MGDYPKHARGALRDVDGAMSNIGVEGNVVAFRERLRAPLKLDDHLPSYHYAVVAAGMIRQMGASVATRFND